MADAPEDDWEDVPNGLEDAGWPDETDGGVDGSSEAADGGAEAVEDLLAARSAYDIAAVVEQPAKGAAAARASSNAAEEGGGSGATTKAKGPAVPRRSRQEINVIVNLQRAQFCASLAAQVYRSEQCSDRALLQALGAMLPIELAPAAPGALPSPDAIARLLAWFSLQFRCYADLREAKEKPFPHAWTGNGVGHAAVGVVGTAGASASSSASAPSAGAGSATTAGSRGSPGNAAGSAKPAALPAALSLRPALRLLQTGTPIQHCASPCDTCFNSGPRGAFSASVITVASLAGALPAHASSAAGTNYSSVHTAAGAAPFAATTLLRLVQQRRLERAVHPHQFVMLWTALLRAAGLRVRLVVAHDVLPTDAAGATLAAGMAGARAYKKAAKRAANELRGGAASAARGDDGMGPTGAVHPELMSPEELRKVTSPLALYSWTEVLCRAAAGGAGSSPASGSSGSRWVCVAPLQQVVDRPLDLSALRPVNNPFSYVIGAEPAASSDDAATSRGKRQRRARGPSQLLEDVTRGYSNRWSSVETVRAQHGMLGAAVGADGAAAVTQGRQVLQARSKAASGARNKRGAGSAAAAGAVDDALLMLAALDGSQVAVPAAALAGSGSSALLAASLLASATAGTSQTWLDSTLQACSARVSTPAAPVSYVSTVRASAGSSGGIAAAADDDLIVIDDDDEVVAAVDRSRSSTASYGGSAAAAASAAPASSGTVSGSKRPRPRSSPANGKACGDLAAHSSSDDDDGDDVMEAAAGGDDDGDDDDDATTTHGTAAKRRKTGTKASPARRSKAVQLTETDGTASSAAAGATGDARSLADILRSLRAEAPPTNAAAYKKHPHYALEQHLLRDEVFHPAGILQPLPPSMSNGARAAATTTASSSSAPASGSSAVDDADDERVLYPPMPTLQLGLFKGSPIYPRRAVHKCKTVDQWYRQDARVVRTSERAHPAKVLPPRAFKRGGAGEPTFKVAFESSSAKAARDAGAAAARDGYGALDASGSGLDGAAPGSVAVYGIWQTELYAPVPVGPDDPIPANDCDEFEMWDEHGVFLPAGLTYLRYSDYPRVLAACKGLDPPVPYKRVITGFDVRQGRPIPVFGGIVVHAGDAARVRSASQVKQQEGILKDISKKQNIIMDRWRVLIRGLWAREDAERIFSSTGAAGASSSSASSSSASSAAGGASTGVSATIIDAVDVLVVNEEDADVDVGAAAAAGALASSSAVSGGQDGSAEGLMAVINKRAVAAAQEAGERAALLKQLDASEAGSVAGGGTTKPDDVFGGGDDDEDM